MMKSTMGSATKALPAETIDNICEYLTNDDILSLRAVGRDTCQKVQDCFLSRFFTHRRQLISKYSLQHFLYISAHPVLRQKLKSVEFVHAEVSRERVELARWMEEEKKQMVVGKWHVYEKNLGNLLDLEEITLALRNLKKAGILPALSVSGDPWNGIHCKNSAAHGAHELLRVHGLDLAIKKHVPLLYIFGHHLLFAHRSESSADAVELVLKSIAEAEFPMEDFTMSLGSLPVFTDFNFVERPDLDDALRSSMFDLQRLSFTLDSKVKTEDLAAFLSAAPRLKSLVVRGNRRRPYLPDGICTALENVKLQSLDLVNARFSRQDLHDILLKQQNTLRDLTMINVGFKEVGDTWTSILEHLATDFNLIRTSLSLHQGRRVLCRSAYREGTAEVQLGLAALIVESEKEELEYDSAEEDGYDDGDDGFYWGSDDEIEIYYGTEEHDYYDHENS